MSIILPHPQTVQVHGVRFLVRTEAGFHRLGHLSWSNRDASLYLTPAKRLLPARVGVERLPAAAPGGSTQVTVRGDFIGGAPYLSLHQSGACHGQAGPPRDRLRTRTLSGRPLDDPAGGHIATIVAFQPSALPPAPAPSQRHGDLALVVNAPSRASSVRVSLFVHTDEATARGAFAQYVTMQRSSLASPLYVGVAAVWEPAVETASSPVIIISGGWGPGVSPTTAIDCIFIITPANIDE